MAKTILNFHFDYWNPSLSTTLADGQTSFQSSCIHSIHYSFFHIIYRHLFDTFYISVNRQEQGAINLLKSFLGPRQGRRNIYFWRAGVENEGSFISSPSPQCLLCHSAKQGRMQDSFCFYDSTSNFVLNCHLNIIFRYNEF